MTTHVEKGFFLSSLARYSSSHSKIKARAPALPSYRFSRFVRMEISLLSLEGRGEQGEELNLHPHTDPELSRVWLFLLERATRWSKVIPGAPGFDISLFLSLKTSTRKAGGGLLPSWKNLLLNVGRSRNTPFPSAAGLSSRALRRSSWRSEQTEELCSLPFQPFSVCC